MEGKDLFLKLAQYRVRVNLNDSDRQKAEERTHLFIKRFPEWQRKAIILGIVRTTRSLLRPRYIDEELIRKFIEKMKEWKKLVVKDDDFEMMSGDEEEEEEEEETLLEEGEEEPTEQDRRVWSYLSSSLGFRMKPGEDVKIVRLMIPFLAQCCGRLPPEGPARCVHIKMFIHQFQTYIIKYCLSDLNDVEMLLDVIKAVESSPANPENKLKKNIPTKEEGIAAPMYLLKLERREYGDHSRKGPAEENLVANPIAIVQSAEGQESYEKSNESLQVNFAASDAGIDLATHSVGLDDNEKDGNCDGSGEFGDYSRKGPAEENLVATPIATVQSADHHENQIYPAANSHKVKEKYRTN
ncbi:hypothetical protein RchiOBHm_Chr2g0127241 [Rosa chinensis]|uniref:Uncharacterized protein n=1 Tax=Rosa chinensis TaxID=74649 RepID=A0A2P6RU13_ROSCH|nr:hypothetical protein RchiOBHm_Chr2g0127241 [Rosa chinensis]